MFELKDPTTLAANKDVSIYVFKTNHHVYVAKWFGPQKYFIQIKNIIKDQSFLSS